MDLCRNFLDAIQPRTEVLTDRQDQQQIHKEVGKNYDKGQTSESSFSKLEQPRNIETLSKKTSHGPDNCELKEN